MPDTAPRSSRAARPSAAVRRTRGARRGAFTLVELLVVIVVVAVVLSLALAALARSRHAAKNTAGLSAARQNLAALVQYVGGAADRFPGLDARALEAFGGGTPGPGGGSTLSEYFLRHASLWILPLLDEPRVDGVLVSGTRDDFHSGAKGVPSARFWLTHHAATLPGYWDDTAPPRGLWWFRPARLGDVQFPSSKALLIDKASGVFDPRAPRPTGGASADRAFVNVGVADGSARAVEWPFDVGSARPPVVERPFGAFPWIIMSTRGGLSAREW